MSGRARLTGTLLALVPAALMIYLAFRGGGFVPGAPAVVAIALILLLGARLIFVVSPVKGFGAFLSVGSIAFAGFALWTLLSGLWSDAPNRALIESDRALLYLLIFVAFGTIGGESWRLSWMIRGIAAAAVIVCAIGLATRLMPEFWPITQQTVGDRLSYPVSYWNTLGLLAALGMIICFGLTSDARESRAVRILTAAAMPLLGSALLLTLSRGAIVASAFGLMVFATVGHPRIMLTALASTVPTTALALIGTYRADLLVTSQKLTAAAEEQGHKLAIVVGLCIAGGALVRALLLIVDDTIARLRPSASFRRWVLAAGAAVAITAALVAALVVNIPHQYDRFIEADASARSETPGDPRAHLIKAANATRVEHWRVAWDGFEAAPLKGRGAGPSS